MWCLGKLDVGIINDLDAISPRIEKVKEGAVQQLGASLRSERADRRPIGNHQAEMTVAALPPKWSLDQCDELIAEIDKGRLGLSPS